MRADRLALKHVIDSVADGASDIDWSALDAQLEEPAVRSLVNQLRILSQVSEVHRSAAFDVDDEVLRSQARMLARTVPPDVLDGGPPGVPIEAPLHWGHLHLQELLGRGSFGEVYHATDTQLQREVAVKLLYQGMPFSRSFDRLLKEARTLARIKHPNVVGIHAAEVRSGRVGLCMEYVKGKTIEALLAEQGLFGEREAAIIGQELCRALAAVHGAGIVHRDVKAQNVMRALGGRVVLMDFGAGQFSDEDPDQPLRLTGTPLYLAPEVLTGGEASFQSDIYSLGVLLFLMVTTRFPVSARSLADLVDAHREGRRLRLHDARPELRDAFVTAIECALDPDPAKRFQSAGAMLTALRSEHVADAAPAPGQAAPPRDSPWWLRSSWLATLVVVVMFAMVAFATWEFRGPGAGGALPPIRSVAVLLDDGSARGDSGVLAAGFAQGLTTALANIEALKVAEWSTAARFGDRGPAEAAAALRVDAVIQLWIAPAGKGEGSGGGGGGTDGGGHRLTARMLGRGLDDLGMETVASPVGRFPQGQAAMAFAIAKRMGVPVSEQDQERLQRGTRQVNPDAYVEFVKGLQRSHRRDQASLKQAVAHYDTAIRLDPEFAAPYAALSEAYSLLRGNFGAYPAQLATDAALGSARKAIDLDRTLVYGWVSLAFARFYLEWNLPSAEVAFKRALELNPADAMAHHHYGNYLSCMGRHEEGLQQRLLARERDPNSLIFTRGVAWNYFFMRRYADAARELEAIMTVDPDLIAVTSLLARTYVMLGRHDDALAMLRKNVDSQGYTDNVEKLAFALAAAGRHAEARTLLARIAEAPRTTYIKPYDLALVHASLGERDIALSLLERAYDERDGTILLMKVDPRLDEVRDDPRFARLLARLGL